ncbi:MAG: nuclease-related domain-containing protein [Bacillota bacterium]
MPEKKQRDLLRSVTSLVSGTAKLQAEMEEGHGPHVLVERLKELSLPENVTIILRPTLAFLNADVCMIGPGRVLVINALHWTGEVGQGKKGEWTGARGVDLGRPDRRAQLFCDRLAYSGLAKGFELEPVVVFTAGPVMYHGGEPEAALVQWDALEDFLRRSLPSGLAGFSAAGLIKALTPH